MLDIASGRPPLKVLFPSCLARRGSGDAFSELPASGVAMLAAIALSAIAASWRSLLLDPPPPAAAVACTASAAVASYSADACNIAPNSIPSASMFSSNCFVGERGTMPPLLCWVTSGGSGERNNEGGVDARPPIECGESGCDAAGEDTSPLMARSGDGGDALLGPPPPLLAVPRLLGLTG